MQKSSEHDVAFVAEGKMSHQTGSKRVNWMERKEKRGVQDEAATCT